MDFTTNYCGMYWNDGKFQSSKLKTTSKPVSKLDELCREHDNNYAFIQKYRQGDMNELAKADEIFYDKAVKLFGLRPQLYARLVKYGNSLLRMGASYTKGLDGFIDILTNGKSQSYLRTGKPRDVNAGGTPLPSSYDVDQVFAHPSTTFDGGQGGSNTGLITTAYVPNEPNVCALPGLSTQVVYHPGGESTTQGYRLRNKVPFFTPANLIHGAKTKRKRKKKNKN